jgi:crossover junction endodeoxyribonuclease RusA
VKFTVYGKPQPQGSVRAFMPKGARFPVVTSDNKALKSWRQEIASVAMVEMNGTAMHTGPMHVMASFMFARPNSLPKRITRKTTKPDVDKLLRGLLDAMTGIVFRDDAQIIVASISKQFGEPERTEVEIGPL